MRHPLVGLLCLSVTFVLAMAAVLAGGANASATFSNFVLTPPSPGMGGSEPAVTIGPDGTVVLGALDWFQFQTDVWKGAFGTAPSAIGPIDAHIGMGVGGGDEDLDLGSTGTLHASTLMFFFNPATRLKQLGVSAISCKNFAAASDFSSCKAQIVDTTQADRQWITSDGPVVYLSYHDSGSSTLIHVLRSTDDGFTWAKVSSPIVGADGVTASSTFNNDQGALIADHFSGNVYAVWAAGEASVQKGTSANFNNIYVSRSSDMGMTWHARLVFHAALNTALNNIFPALAVDPSNGHLYASWSDAHNVSVSVSKDEGATWSSAVVVNTGGAVTAVFPAIAARSGIVDLAYYGTTGTSKDFPGDVWITYMSQSLDDGATWTQSIVSSHPNHVGVICTLGTGCVNPLVTRTLLDLFEVAINAQGKAAVIYTDDTMATYTLNGTTFPLPLTVVGYQN